MSENDGGSPPPRAGWRGRVKRTHAVIAGVSAALISLFAILGGVFDVFPGLKPAAPCPREHSVTLSNVVLDDSVTRKQALILARASSEGVPAKRLAQPGKLVSVDLQAKGYDGQRMQIRTWVLTEQGAPVMDRELMDQLAYQVVPNGCDDGGTFQVWSPTPRAAGRYRIRLELVASDGRSVLKRQQTDVFSVDAPPS